jgi:putative transposase
VLVVMDQFTRRIIGFGVHAGDVDGLALCRMFNTAISTKGAPQYLSSDHDPLFTHHRWTANLRILDVHAIKSIPYTPRSHPFIERLIGTIRREFLDHTLFWNAVDLERKLDTFKDYYNRSRTHASLGGNTPAGIGCDRVAQPARLETYAWERHCGGLFQLPVAA